jgi:P27 family predicted phage terminase small subunit
MGSRGPIRNPNSLRYNDRKKPEKTLADVPADELGEARMPSWLTGDGRKFWKQHAPKLKQLGRLTALDSVSFAVVCSSYELLRQIDTKIEEDGFVLEGPRGGVKPHPLLSTRDKWFKSFIEGCKQFGLSPSSRARLPAPPDRGRFDAIDEFLTGRSTPVLVELDDRREGN